MVYTTQGLMTQADYEDYLKDTDQGWTDIDVADWPAAFTRPERCPVCGDVLTEDTHESVRAGDASGEVYGCLRWDGAGWTFPDEAGR